VINLGIEKRGVQKDNVNMLPASALRYELPNERSGEDFFDKLKIL